MTADRRIGVVAGPDAFARGVAAALGTGITGHGWEVRPADLAPDPDAAQLLMAADVTVVVLDRHDGVLVDRFDRASHGTLRPWLSITVRHPFVQVGPYVSPFVGACHECLRMRLGQHGRSDPLAERSAATPGGWTRGLPPYLAVTVAGAALGLLVAGAPADRRDGMVLVHTNGLPVSRVPVVGVHLCPRCGDQLGRRPPARDSERIRTALAAARPVR